MILNIHIITLLALIASAQGIFLSLYLFCKKSGNIKANRILAVLLLLFVLRFLETSAYWSDFFLYHPHFVFITNTFPFLFGLLLFFYARFLLTEDQKFSKKDVFHFIPFILFFVYAARFYIRPAEYKLGMITTQIQTTEPELPVMFFVIRFVQYAHMFVYVFFTLKIVYSYNQLLTEINITELRSKLNWLKNLSIGFIIVILLNLIELIQLYFFRLEPLRIIDTTIAFAFLILIYIAAYFAISQREISRDSLLKKPFTKYRRSTLTPEKSEQISGQVLHLFEKEKPYINPELRLSDISDLLNISSHHLSQVINSKFNLSFIDFINSYRVEEVKNLLKDTKFAHLTLLAIGFEAGFKNKTSFNNAFKKFTGTTPSEYKQSVNHSE